MDAGSPSQQNDHKQMVVDSTNNSLKYVRWTTQPAERPQTDGRGLNEHTTRRKEAGGRCSRNDSNYRTGVRPTGRSVRSPPHPPRLGTGLKPDSKSNKARGVALLTQLRPGCVSTRSTHSLREPEKGVLASEKVIWNISACFPAGVPKRV